VVSITVDNTTIEATAYHPFWVIDGRDLQERSKPRELQEHEDEGHSLPGRWVNSHELRAGDCIIARSGTRALITEIRQRFDDAFPVCNLTITGHHNYAVGDVGVLVHNVSICDDAIAAAKSKISNGTSIDKIRNNLNKMVKNGKHTQEEVDEALKKILDPNWKPAPNRVIDSLADIPTNAKGFDEWFDSLTPDELASLYNNQSFRNKIETQLRNGGRMHEFLMVAEAPHWKKWGVTADQVKGEFAVAIETLNDSLAKGWKHSTGLKGSKSPGSKTAHNELQKIIRESNSLDDFKRNIRVWAERFLNGGFDSLPPGFHN
jgi:hypothetical protein